MAIPQSYISRTTSSFNPYAAGNKIYGGGSSAPTTGPVDPTGYAERDLTANARRDAILRRLKANASGDYGSPDAIRQV